MALERIKSERAIKALKPGDGRVNDGGGLYLVPFAWEQSHYWRMDYTHQGRRRTLSLGVWPEIGLEQARAMASEARAQLVSGIDPMEERKAQRGKIQDAAQNERLIKAGLPAIGSFEDVARRWFDVKQTHWMSSYSSKVIRRLELHAFPRFGNAPIGTITPVTVLEACRAVERNDKPHHPIRHCCVAALHGCGGRQHQKTTCTPMNHFITALLQDEERSKTVLAAMTAIAGLLAIVLAAAFNMCFFST